MIKYLLIGTFALFSLGMLTNGASAQSCPQLRFACEHKVELGQEGYGNCQRYRERCERRVIEDPCAKLKYLCEHKAELGQEGLGNCKRFRQECGAQ
jgi:hypothetical protein